MLLLQKIIWLYWHFNKKHFTIFIKKYDFYSWFLMQEWNKILNSLDNSQPEVEVFLLYKN